MKNDMIFLVLALITGALIPIQAATNAAFSKAVGNASVTTLMVLLVGLLAMGVFVIFSKASVPTGRELSSAPWYSYLGGFIVATYIVMITILVPRIGVGAAIGLIVTGQILCAVTIDHFGFFGVAVNPISLRRLGGMCLMIAGIYLVMKK